MSADQATADRAAAGVAGEPPGRLSVAAIALAVALLAVSFAAFDERLFSPHIVPRQAVVLPLALALAVVWVLWYRPGSRALRFDVVDVAALAFGLWVAVTAMASPAPWMAWLGYYNRGTGVAFVLVEVLLLLVARRVLVSRQAVRALVWAVSALLVLLAGVAVVQAAGGDVYWSVPDLWPGRWTGTTGNPLTIAGLSLLGLWLGAWLLAGRFTTSGVRVEARASRKRARRRQRRATRARGARTDVHPWRWTQWAALAGVAAGLVANLLAVSRASYVGWTAGLVLIAVWVLRQRALRELAAVLVVLGVLAVSALVPVPDGEGGSRTFLGRVEGSREQTARPGAGDSLSGADDSRLAATPPAESGGLSDNDSRRLDLWRTAARAIAARPLAGYGGGAYVAADRRHISPEQRFAHPWRFSSDPHSLPLLVGATTGVVGLLLFGALVVLVARLLLRNAAGLPTTAAPKGGSAARAARAAHAARSTTGNVSGAQVALPATSALAGLAYLAASAVFLLFGPLDLAVAVPIALLAGVSAPIGDGLSGRVWAAPRLKSDTAGNIVTAAAAAFLALACVAAVVLGVRLYRADLAIAAFAASDSAAEARRAESLFPWEPFYALEAGAATWRTAAVASDASPDRAGMREGEALVRSGIRRDPTGPTGYADLARFAIATGRLEAVADEVRAGLTANPHNPVLEGLWVYAAVEALSRSDAGVAASLHESLLAEDPRSPDAWYWTSVYLKAVGDEAGAADALRRAEQLAPRLKTNGYRERLLRGR